MAYTTQLQEWKADGKGVASPPFHSPSLFLEKKGIRSKNRKNLCAEFEKLFEFAYMK